MRASLCGASDWRGAYGPYLFDFFPAWIPFRIVFCNYFKFPQCRLGVKLVLQEINCRPLGIKEAVNLPAAETEGK